MKRHLSAPAIQARRLELGIARGDVAVAVAVVATARGGTYSVKRAVRELDKAEQHGPFQPFSVRPVVAAAYETVLAAEPGGLDHADAAVFADGAFPHRFERTTHGR